MIKAIREWWNVLKFWREVHRYPAALYQRIHVSKTLYVPGLRKLGDEELCKRLARVVSEGAMPANVEVQWVREQDNANKGKFVVRVVTTGRALLENNYVASLSPEARQKLPKKSELLALVPKEGEA